MARLPQPGGDSGNWGTILNDYLTQAHNSDGTIRDDAVTATAIADGSVTETLLSSAVQIKLNATAGTPDWSTIVNKPAVIAAGATQAAARTTLGVVIGTDVQAHDTDLDAVAGLTPSNDDVLQRKAGAWTNRTIAQLKTDIGVSGTNTGDQTSVTGNAGTATTLATPRAINGVNFDGSAAITVADATKVPLSTVTAKGDLLAASASGVVARLAVGSDTQVLTADSTQTTGVKWATPTSGGGGAATVYSLGNLGATYTLTSSDGICYGILTANTVISLPSPSAGMQFMLVLKENLTGGWSPSFGGAAVDYPAGDPSWVTSASAFNVLEFRAWDSSAWHVFPATSGAYADYVTVNGQTGNYTLALSDIGNAVEVTSASAQTVTVPSDSSVAFPVGSVVEVTRMGTGSVTLAAESGAILHSASSLILSARYSTCTIRKQDVNTWLVSGDMQ